MKQKKLYLILHNIRSVHNVASIFRTADGVGVFKIYLTGYTPKPTDEFGKIRKDFKKISLGAEKTMNWEYVKNINKVIGMLKSDIDINRKNAMIPNYRSRTPAVVALEQSKDSINYKKFKPKFPMALIAGNEVSGISKKILEKCGAIIEIPMLGKKESLNVSIATGIALYEILC